MIEVQATDLHELAVKLAEVEPRLRVLLRHEIADAGQDAAEAVKQEAGWSSRIPGAVKVKVSFAARGSGATITVDRKKAPEARPLEHGGRPGNVRHPVYADPNKPREDWTWTEKEDARPFFFKALSGYEYGAFQAKVEAIGEEFALALGFH